MATHLENFNDFASDAVNEFSPEGLEQFGAMMVSDDGDWEMEPMSMGATSKQVLQVILLMGTAVTLNM